MVPRWGFGGGVWIGDQGGALAWLVQGLRPDWPASIETRTLRMNSPDLVCPYCGSSVVWRPLNLGNLLRGVAYVMVAFVVLAVALVFAGSPDHLWPTIRWHWRCWACGGHFSMVPGGSTRLRSVPVVCGQCGYNLKGNVSGRCPECGWFIPEIMKVERKPRKGR